mmetsp:Transcript_37082/g.60428  ORF Transcript_37082/g.60428 Transcript_37082/m.60428 type:complete len:97 (-) Transcript_37082:1924-2214(-)
MLPHFSTLAVLDRTKLIYSLYRDTASLHIFPSYVFNRTKLIYSLLVSRYNLASRRIRGLTRNENQKNSRANSETKHKRKQQKKNNKQNNKGKGKQR